MGCWGYGPFDNDPAGDMVARLSQDVKRVVNAKTDSAARYRYETARVGAHVMLLAHGTDILGGPCIELAVKALARMRGDAEWLGSFRAPKKMAETLTEELATFLGRMRGCAGCRKRYKKAENKKDFVELVELVKAANDVKPKRLPRPKIRRVSKSEMKAIKAKARRAEAKKKKAKAAKKKGTKR
jgi:hypothetical protein